MLYFDLYFTKHFVLNSFRIMKDGLGDTIRVSLTEAPELEIDPCRRLANLGMRGAELQKGVVRLHNYIMVQNFHDSLGNVFF